MKVLKFGGSSIADPKCISRVKRIVESLNGQVVIVVSAFQGITDDLLQIAEMAFSKNDEYKRLLEDLEKMHMVIITECISESERDKTECEYLSLYNKLKDTLKGVFLLGDLSPKIQDYVLSFGERMSALIMSTVIDGAKCLDSTKVIIADSNYGRAIVDMEKSEKRINEAISSLDKSMVVPGFIASTEEGLTVTLGRGGSDYSAAIFANALKAEELQIWTDVDGFMTADPRKVEKAFAIDALTYAEAMELSHFGAKVIYTPTIKPAFKSNIPIRIKNSFKPDIQGTLISSEDSSSTKSKIKGISSIDDVALVTLQGAGLVGVSGISMRLFGALARHRINIILITQSSSEFSICFAITPDDAEKAGIAIEEEFEKEIRFSKEINYSIENDLSIIAIVGGKMKNTPGISANLFNSLGRNGINIVAIAQGSSELNISIVIQKQGLKKAMNVIHEGFFLSDYRELHLYLVGVGTVGSSLLKQIHQQKEKLLNEYKLIINLVGVARSKVMLVDENGINPETCIDRLNSEGEPTNFDTYIEKIKKLNLRNSVFIDCTADATVSSYYKKVLDSFTSLVTANKIACSSEYDHYIDLKNKAKDKGVKLFFETNVGAGLPILGTISDLMRSGDKIIKLEAVLSGTLNFIFNVISKDIPLSKAILLAKEKGFSEPDPRIDLSGVDVVRKLLILARESGYKLEQENVAIESFLPADCFEGTLDDFWKKVAEHDAGFETRRIQLEKENKKWRFVATFDQGKASVSLQEVDVTHPAYNLEGSNNIILITTERYNEEPMIIKGYGAGAEVTAAGVFADIIRVANV